MEAERVVDGPKVGSGLTMFRNDVYFVSPTKYRKRGLVALLAAAIALSFAADRVLMVEEEIAELQSRLLSLTPSTVASSEIGDATRVEADVNGALLYDWNAFAAALESERMVDWRVVSVSYTRGSRAAEIEIETDAAKFSGESAVGIPSNVTVKAIRRLRDTNAVRVIGSLQLNP